MKQLVFIFFALLLFSCGSNGEPDASSLKEQLNEKEKALFDLEGEISALKKQIAVIDGIDTSLSVGTLVTLHPAIDTTFYHFIEIQGVVESDNNIIHSSDVGGLITSIPVKEGQYVNKGQILAKTDNSIILNNINEVKTTLDLATNVFEKQERLWSQNIGSEMQYLEAKNTKERLESQLSTLNAQLNKANIRSAISGYVDEIFKKSGEMISPGTPVLRVVNLTEVTVEASVPESYLKSINKSNKVNIFFPALDETVDARVKSIGQVIDPSNRTFKVAFQIPNKTKLIKPNLLAVVRINDYKKDKAVIIPTRLIQESKGSKVLFVADKEGKDIKAKQVKIKLGKTYKGISEVVSGLDAGTMLIDEGYREVSNGDVITISNL